MSGANRRASRGFIQTSVSDSCREGYSDLRSNGAFPEQTLHICAGKIGYCSVSNASRKAGVISSSLIAGSSKIAGRTWYTVRPVFVSLKKCRESPSDRYRCYALRQ